MPCLVPSGSPCSRGVCQTCRANTIDIFAVHVVNCGLEDTERYSEVRDSTKRHRTTRKEILLQSLQDGRDRPDRRMEGFSWTPGSLLPDRLQAVYLGVQWPTEVAAAWCWVPGCR